MHTIILDKAVPVFDDATYDTVAGTKYITDDGVNSETLPADTGGTSFPLDADSTDGFLNTDPIDAGEVQTFTFRAVVDEFADLTPGADSITNEGELRVNGETIDKFQVTVPLDFAAGINVEKFTNGEDADSQTGPKIAVGSPVTWTYEVTNTGNVFLNEIRVTDDDNGVTPVYQNGDDNGNGILETGETWVYEATATAIDGQYSNKATATGEPVYSDGTPVPDVAEASANDLSHYFGGTFELTLVKSVTDVGGNGPGGSVDAVGDVIKYSITATNDGDLPLTNVTVVDPLLGTLTCDPAQPATLAPDAAITCKGSYTALQADIDNNGGGDGDIDNTATANSNETVPVNASEDVPITRTPGMTVEKSSATTSLSAPGTVNYSYLVTNPGNVTLTGISLADNNDNDDMDCGGQTTLDPGDTMTCTATHTFTQAELDASGSPTADSGVLYNLVTANSNEAPDATDDLSIPINQDPKMTVEKSLKSNADEDGSENVSLNDTLTYQFVASNTGNITLSGVTVVDPLPGLSALSCKPASLAPGEALTCTATYTVTQADVDAGNVHNEATADSDQTDPVKDPEDVPVPQKPELTLVKSASPATYSAVGQVISYEYLVTNSGNVTLTGISLEDNNIDAGTMSCPIGDLAPGAAMTCTAKLHHNPERPGQRFGDQRGYCYGERSERKSGDLTGRLRKG